MKTTHRLAAAVLGLIAIMHIQQADAQCPPNSSPVYQTENIVHCRCNAGFENKDGVCVRVDEKFSAAAATLAVDKAEAGVDPVIKGINAMAKRLRWDPDKLKRLNRALNDLNWADDGNVTDLQVQRVWQDIKARSRDEALARKASRGEGPVFPGAGKQTRYKDCAIFALANAAGLPYGVVAARAGEVIREAEWRSAEERADPQRTIERRGLNGGEVVFLAEAFGQSKVAPTADFVETLKEGSPILLDVRHRTGTREGHQVVLTKSFRHNGETWYEMMDSHQGPTQRLYLSHKELNAVVLQNGVAFRREPGSVPELLR